jgi:hypothetical protein
MTSMILMLLSGASVFPAIDRLELDRQARAEASRAAVVKVAAAKAVAPAKAKPRASKAAAVAAEPTYSLTAVCRAAGEARDTTDFLAAFARGYRLSAAQHAELRQTCGLYFTGKREGRQAFLASLR